MRTSLFVLLSSAVCLAIGCSRSTPSAAMLPDTPVTMKTPAPRQSVVEFDAGTDPTVEDLPDHVRLLRDKVEAQDRSFGERNGQPAPDDGAADSARPSARTPLWTPPPSSPPRDDRGTASRDWTTSRPPARPPEKPSAQPPLPVHAQGGNRAEPQGPDVAVVPAIPPKPESEPQPPLAQQGASTPAPPSANVAQPLRSTATADTDILRRSLMERVKAHPTDLASHLNLQLFHFLNDEPVPQLESLEPLPKEQRDMVVTLLDGLKNFRHTVQTDPNSLPSQIVSPLLAMADLLREQTELSVPTIQLCRKVDGYGVYEPMELTFRAGLEYETIIYCEVENFSSRQNNDLWETKLSMEAVLYNSAGDAILRGKDDVPTDRCRNCRRDFFVVKRLKLPASLSASRYILKVTIVDEQAKRVAENSLSIMMMAQ